MANQTTASASTATAWTIARRPSDMHRSAASGLGYPWLIHRLTYRRHGHANVHVRGHIEDGSTTTPFDMVVRNDLDRFHLVSAVIDRVPGLANRAAHVETAIRDKLQEHHVYIREHGEDLPEIRNWKW